MLEHTKPYFYNYFNEEEIKKFEALDCEDEEALEEFFRHTVHKFKSGTKGGKSQAKDYMQKQRALAKIKRKEKRKARRAKRRYTE